MPTPTLAIPDVRRLSRILRDAGLSLPRAGWSLQLPEPAALAFASNASGWLCAPGRVVRDARGLFFTSWHHAPEA